MERDAGCSHVDSLNTWATTSGSVQTIVLEVALSFATRPFEQLYWFSLCTAPSKRPKVSPEKTKLFDRLLCRPASDIKSSFHGQV